MAARPPDNETISPLPLRAPIASGLATRFGDSMELDGGIAAFAAPHGT